MLQRVLTFILSVLKKPEKQEKEVSPLPILTASVSEQVIPSLPPEPEKQLLDPDAESKLAKLYPPFADAVRELVLQARAKGMPVSIFQGLRTFGQQLELYKKGRDANFKVIDKKQVVTNAPPGMSMHNYGLAVDLVFDGDEVRPGYQWSWANKHPWKQLALLGKGCGLEPAFFWKTFPESPHFEKSYGMTYRELHSVYSEGGTELVWSVLDVKKKGATVA